MTTTIPMTMPKCFFCGDSATTFNDQQLRACRSCKNRVSEQDCPVCREPMDIVPGGKYGTYFECLLCGKKWSQFHISRLNYDN